jgi:predicted AlkP superfamily phosphohydrolase/phosphomutase
MRLVRGLWILVALLALPACGAPTPAAGRRLVVIGVDGLDPEITARLMREGRAPHLASLAAASGLVRVIATPGAESASTWASLVTGRNAGAHGIFDMVEPNGPGGRPGLGPLRLEPPAHGLGGWWRPGPRYARVNPLDGLWAPLASGGVRTTLLFVHGTFPAQPVRGGTVIAGRPLPDWSGAPGSSYTWLATDVPPGTPTYTRYGGRVVPLAFPTNLAESTVHGLTGASPGDLPISITWNPEARSANITLGGDAVHLAEGQVSPWLTVGVQLNLVTRVEGLTRLHLRKAGNDLQLYVAPIQWHPGRPPSPISAPAGAAGALFERLGPYRTLAWPGSGWALADGYLSEEAFIEAQEETFTDRAEALLNRMDSGSWDFLMAGIETVDTTTRLLWRTLDPGHAAYDPALARRWGTAVDRHYLRLDALVGEVRRRLPVDADLVVLSPYGTYTARAVVDLNRWLTTRGLLAWRTPPAPVSLAALTRPSAWADTVDWSRTSARAMGAGHLYLNVRGRDPQGTVEPGAAYDALVATLRADLARLTDPLSGQRVVSRVRTGGELFSGPAAARAPDLVVTFSPGFRASWDSTLGGMAAEVVARNTERWSAEHGSVDEQHVPGVWLSSMRVTADTMSVLDIAPTLLAYFGMGPPAGADGTARLLAPPSTGGAAHPAAIVPSQPRR